MGVEIEREMESVKLLGCTLHDAREQFNKASAEIQ